MKPNALEKRCKEGRAGGVKLCRKEEEQPHIVYLLFQPRLD